MGKLLPGVNTFIALQNLNFTSGFTFYDSWSCTFSKPVLTSSIWWKVFSGTRCWRTFQWNVAIESEWETQTIKWGDKVDVEDLKLWKRFIHILNPCKYLEQNNSIYVLFLQLARPVPSFPAQIRQPFSHLCLQSSSVSPVLQNLQPA